MTRTPQNLSTPPEISILDARATKPSTRIVSPPPDDRHDVGLARSRVGGGCRRPPRIAAREWPVAGGEWPVARPTGVGGRWRTRAATAGGGGGGPAARPGPADGCRSRSRATVTRVAGSGRAGEWCSAWLDECPAGCFWARSVTARTYRVWLSTTAASGRPVPSGGGRRSPLQARTHCAGPATRAAPWGSVSKSPSVANSAHYGGPASQPPGGETGRPGAAPDARQ